MSIRIGTILRKDCHAGRKVILSAIRRSDPTVFYRVLLVDVDEFTAYMDYNTKESALKKYEECEGRFLYGNRK